MKTSKFIYACIILNTIIISSCDKLAEEETPVCKDCYKFKYDKATNQLITKDGLKRLCGGDVVAWENISDDVTDSTTTKYKCE
ncbi:MAG: hypothetical protein A2046_04945 [Bacteroidetes bacterium GWA2_30_7]|nr:MAG: hypothetical protein A2046_04945 [Bacteroidetes bacterium GWA2_30_7]